MAADSDPKQDAVEVYDRSHNDHRDSDEQLVGNALSRSEMAAPAVSGALSWANG